MIRAIVIDDEMRAIESLSSLVRELCPTVKVVATSTNVEHALSKIEELDPDLLFLDIRIGGRTGFDLLENLNEGVNPSVIFTTAYDQYAIKAIRLSALDYLLKPINPEELVTAVSKIKPDAFSGDKLAALLSNFRTGLEQDLDIVLPTTSGFDLTKVGDIEYLEADKNYTYVFLNDKKRLYICRSIKEFDDLLNDRGFVRCHQSFLVNSRYVRSFKSTGRLGKVILKSGAEIEVSRNQKKKFVDTFKSRDI